MASKAQIVAEILDEIGKSSPQVSRQVELAVGEITVDLLSQNDCRFIGLQKTQTISIVVGTREYRLNPDFATAQRNFIEVDSDDDFVRRITVVDETTYIDRLADPNYGGSGVRYSYIDFNVEGSSGRGDYLVLAADPTATGTYKFPYYRRPTINDTDLIRNTHILKTGVRGELSSLFADSRTEASIYMNMRQGFRESPSTRTTGMMLRPDKHTQKRNRMMSKISRGQ